MTVIEDLELMEPDERAKAEREMSNARDWAKAIRRSLDIYAEEGVPPELAIQVIATLQLFSGTLSVRMVASAEDAFRQQEQMAGALRAMRAVMDEEEG